MDVGEPFLKNGTLVRTLAAGHFSEAANAKVDPDERAKFRENERIQDSALRVSLRTGSERVYTQRSSTVGRVGQLGYLSELLGASPRSLDNMLIEPNVPKVDLAFESQDAIELFLNGKSIFTHLAGGESAVASGLPLQQGWNHFLVRAGSHKDGGDTFSAKLTSSDPAFLDSLHSALQKP